MHMDVKGTMFVYYSPHVNSVSICVYLDKWSVNGTDEDYCVYLNKENAAQKLKALIRYIKHLSKEENK